MYLMTYISVRLGSHRGDNFGRSGLCFRPEILFLDKLGLETLETLISVFQEFSSSINKAFVLAGCWALGYRSMGFRQFPDIL